VKGVAACVLLLLAGCVGPEPGTEPWPDFGSIEAFEAQAQPILVERCANPSCHGDPGRPLSIYAPHRHRLDPSAVYSNEPLTDEERTHNFLQTTAFLMDVPSAEGSLLLTKPLAPEVGGAAHGGGPVFLDRHDYGYRELLEWSTRALDPVDDPL